MEVVIIRPPLVYGPGVKANFQTMMRWLARGVPLPLGAIPNRRSLVALDNLVGAGLSKPVRLIFVPSTLLKVGAALLGKPAIAQRLCGSLRLDISKTRQLLGWRPPLSVDEGLTEAAEGFQVKRLFYFLVRQGATNLWFSGMAFPRPHARSRDIPPMSGHFNLKIRQRRLRSRIQGSDQEYPDAAGFAATVPLLGAPLEPYSDLKKSRTGHCLWPYKLLECI